MKTNKPFQLFFLFLCFSILKVTIASQTPSSDARSELKPNDTITREMTGKIAHRYEFDLKKNDFFQVKAEQKGIDVTLKLLDESGKVLAEMDSPNGKTGFETLSFIASNDGNFVLEIISPNEKAEKGAYILKRESSRTATAQDKRRVEIEKIFVEGIKALETIGKREFAVIKLGESLIGWKQLNDVYLINITSDAELTATFLAFYDESARASQILQETRDLNRKSRLNNIAAREKADEALKAFRTLNSKVNSKLLVEKINDSKKGHLLDTLKELQLLVKVNEIEVLGEIADTYYPVGEWQQRVDILKQIISLNEELISDDYFKKSSNLYGNYFLKRVNQANTFILIGQILDSYLGQTEEAIKYFESGILLYRSLNQDLENPNFKLDKSQFDFRKREALALNEIGDAYGRNANNRAKAIESFSKAVEIYKSYADQKRETASALYLIGNQYALELNFDLAFKNINEALKFYEEINDKSGQARCLELKAIFYFWLNDRLKSDQVFKKIIDIFQSPNFNENDKKNRFINPNGLWQERIDNVVERERLSGIAVAYKFLENYEKSNEFYEKALIVASSNQEINHIKTISGSIAQNYSSLKQWDKAIEYYNRSLEITRKRDDKEDIAQDLQDLGWTFLEAGKSTDALQYQNKALAIYQSTNIDESKNFSVIYSNLLNEISRTHYSLGNNSLAIFYGKRAINAMQAERQRLQNLDLISQKGFLEKKEKHYRRLAEWLIESGRLVEAERVLEMLKDEEIGDYLRRDTAFVQKTALQIEYNSAEKKAIEDYRSKSETLSSIGAEFSKLEDLKRKNVKLTAEQDKQFAELNAKITTANKEFQNFLVRLSEEFGKEKDPVGNLREEYNLQTNLEEWGGNVVFVYTLIGSKHFRAILTTQNVKVEKDKEITQAELNKKIYAFREAVKNPNVDPRPLGKELYDILILPIEKELDDAKAKTILWRLDGNLRLLPLAALWDGKQYFGQKYQNVVITGKSLTNIGREISPNLNVLGLGVSESKTVAETLTERSFIFSALPAVPSELSSIVKTQKSPKGVLPGESFLDAQFTKKNFQEQLGKRYKIVHIASHFSVNAGDASRSFLLLGDGTTLSVNELNESPSLKFTGVELLTLSACDTAVGETDSNAREVEGFAYVAQQNGAKAILATLWSVADNSTQLLMTEFYRLRKTNPNLTKAEAMQLAQKAMIEGKLKSDQAGNLKGTELAGVKQSQQPKFDKDPKSPFAHPYYWSPFVLIGNWK